MQKGYQDFSEILEKNCGFSTAKSKTLMNLSVDRIFSLFPTALTILKFLRSYVSLKATSCHTYELYYS